MKTSKKILQTFLILLLTSTTFFTQEKGWSLGIIGSPNFYSIKSPKGFNHTYHSEVGYTIGVESIHTVNDKLSLGFGLGASKLAYQANYQFIFYDSMDESVARYSDIVITYLDIPLFLRLKLASGDNINFYSTLAINSSIILKADDKTTHEDNSIRASNSLRNFLLSGQIGLGISYKLNENLLIKIEPRVRFHINGFDSSMNYFPKVFQSVIGIEYKIGKQE